MFKFLFILTLIISDLFSDSEMKTISSLSHIHRNAIGSELTRKGSFRNTLVSTIRALNWKSKTQLTTVPKNAYERQKQHEMYRMIVKYGKKKAILFSIEKFLIKTIEHYIFKFLALLNKLDD